MIPTDIISDEGLCQKYELPGRRTLIIPSHQGRYVSYQRTSFGAARILHGIANGFEEFKNRI